MAMSAPPRSSSLAEIQPSTILRYEPCFRLTQCLNFRRKSVSRISRLNSHSTYADAISHYVPSSCRRFGRQWQLADEPTTDHWSDRKESRQDPCRRDGFACFGHSRTADGDLYLDSCE